jgi:hypothetical protein
MKCVSFYSEYWYWYYYYCYWGIGEWEGLDPGAKKDSLG